METVGIGEQRMHARGTQEISNRLLYMVISCRLFGIQQVFLWQKQGHPHSAYPMMTKIIKDIVCAYSPFTRSPKLWRSMKENVRECQAWLARETWFHYGWEYHNHIFGISCNRHIPQATTKLGPPNHPTEKEWQTLFIAYLAAVMNRMFVSPTHPTPSHSYVEDLTPNVIIFEDEAFGK